MSIMEFITGNKTYSLPPPGGSIVLGSASDGDAYLAAIAATIKEKWMDGDEVIEYLTRRRTTIENQLHFTAQIDILMIGRINAWIRELVS